MNDQLPGPLKRPEKSGKRILEQSFNERDAYVTGIWLLSAHIKSLTLNRSYRGYPIFRQTSEGIKSNKLRIRIGINAREVFDAVTFVNAELQVLYWFVANKFLVDVVIHFQPGLEYWTVSQTVLPPAFQLWLIGNKPEQLGIRQHC
jgi:hypothetical protein